MTKMCKRLKLAGVLLVATFVQMACAEAGSSCIITPGTPATWASLDFGAAIPSFDSYAVFKAMCNPAVFAPFDSRFMTSDFGVLPRFRSDRFKSINISFR